MTERRIEFAFLTSASAGPHSRWSITVEQDRDRIRAPIQGFEPPAKPGECVGAYADAVRAGLFTEGPETPVSLTPFEPDQRGNIIVHRYELELPRLVRPALRPLGAMMSETWQRSGFVGARLVEIGSGPLESVPFERLPQLPKVTPPFDYDRATGRDRYDLMSVVVRFASDLPDEAGLQLSHWATAWGKLIQMGAFTHPAGGTVSGFLDSVVDAYPDEWVIRFSDFRVTDEACAPLLAKLVELHSRHPITSVEIR